MLFSYVNLRRKIYANLRPALSSRDAFLLLVNIVIVLSLLLWYRSSRMRELYLLGFLFIGVRLRTRPNVPFGTGGYPVACRGDEKASCALCPAAAGHLSNKLHPDSPSPQRLEGSARKFILSTTTYAKIRPRN